LSVIFYRACAMKGRAGSKSNDLAEKTYALVVTVVDICIILFE